MKLGVSEGRWHTLEMGSARRDGRGLVLRTAAGPLLTHRADRGSEGRGAETKCVTCWLLVVACATDEAEMCGSLAEVSMSWRLLLELPVSSLAWIASTRCSSCGQYLLSGMCVSRTLECIYCARRASLQGGGIGYGAE